MAVCTGKGWERGRGGREGGREGERREGERWRQYSKLKGAGSQYDVSYVTFVSAIFNAL